MKLNNRDERPQDTQAALLFSRVALMKNKTGLPYQCMDPHEQGRYWLHLQMHRRIISHAMIMTTDLIQNAQKFNQNTTELPFKGIITFSLCWSANYQNLSQLIEKPCKLHGYFLLPCCEAWQSPSKGKDKSRESIYKWQRAVFCKQEAVK